MADVAIYTAVQLSSEEFQRKKKDGHAGCCRPSVARPSPSLSHALFHSLPRAMSLFYVAAGGDPSDLRLKNDGIFTTTTNDQVNRASRSLLLFRSTLVFWSLPPPFAVLVPLSRTQNTKA